jgi:hypothetical protein
MTKEERLRTGECCDNCRFWRKEPDEGGMVQAVAGILAQCRRHAPRPLTQMVLHGDDPPEYNFFETYWPTTGEDEWCGEYQRAV